MSRLLIEHPKCLGAPPIFVSTEEMTEPERDAFSWFLQWLCDWNFDQPVRDPDDLYSRVDTDREFTACTVRLLEAIAAGTLVLPCELSVPVGLQFLPAIQYTDSEAGSEPVGK